MKIRVMTSLHHLHQNLHQMDESELKFIVRCKHGVYEIKGFIGKSGN